MSYAKKSRSSIMNFGDPNVAALIARFSQLAHSPKAGQTIRISQFGDSHSAADLFTGELRALLQKKYGDAGIGWIPPIAIKGQYHAAVKWQASHWQLLSSQTRGQQPEGFKFPMGGFIAKSTKTKSSIHITPNTIADRLWQVNLLFRTSKMMPSKLALYGANRQKVAVNTQIATSKWQRASTKLKMPLVIESEGAIELGGIWLMHDNPSGVLVSSIAVNGAKQSVWQKWNPDWYTELISSQTDLVILAYGANESIDSTLDLNEYTQNLISNIRKVRALLPKAVVLLISPPDTMISENHEAPLLNAIKAIQLQVASSEKTLLWDWQQAMGGPFSIKHWLNERLARPDLVHQTAKGYQLSAKIFYADFVEFMEKR